MSAELTTRWAAAVARALADAGVRRVLIAPGSRSTPLVFACLEQPGLSVDSIIDERCAGFFALGVAKISGEPAVAITTSGTAAAHLYPAVIEAAHSEAPLLALTADRPAGLQQVSAPQTIDQTRLYGPFARGFFDLGLPCEAHLASVARKLTQALALTRDPSPGPVQVNVPFDKPLEPQPLEPSATPSPRVITPRRAAVDPAELAAARRAVGDAKRGLVVLGPAARSVAPALLAELVERTGFALVPDAQCSQRYALGGVATEAIADGADWWLGGAGAPPPPDLVLQLGGPPLHAGWGRWLSQGTTLLVFGSHGFADPTQRATEVVLGDVDANVRGLLAGFESSREALGRRREYRSRLAAASARAFEAVDAHLARRATELSELGTARSVVDALGPQDVLVVGNSSPIRLLGLACRARAVGPRLVVQRGANGIDGLLALAAGVASAHAGRTALFLGDVSFQHDVGGLATTRLARQPLPIVVLDNGGGRLFEQLPVWPLVSGRAHERFWTTPPELDIGAAATAFGVPHERAQTVLELERGLTRALERGGATVLWARVPAHGASQDQRSIAARLQEATP